VAQSESLGRRRPVLPLPANRRKNAPAYFWSMLEPGMSGQQCTFLCNWTIGCTVRPAPPSFRGDVGVERPPPNLSAFGYYRTQCQAGMPGFHGIGGGGLWSTTEKPDRVDRRWRVRTRVGDARLVKQLAHLARGDAFEGGKSLTGGKPRPAAASEHSTSRWVGHAPRCQWCRTGARRVVAHCPAADVPNSQGRGWRVFVRRTPKGLPPSRTITFEGP